MGAFTPGKDFDGGIKSMLSDGSNYSYRDLLGPHHHPEIEPEKDQADISDIIEIAMDPESDVRMESDNFVTIRKGDSCIKIDTKASTYEIINLSSSENQSAWKNFYNYSGCDERIADIVNFYSIFRKRSCQIPDHLKKIWENEKVRAQKEVKFSEKHGLPAAITDHLFFTVLRMDDGSYWKEIKGDKVFSFEEIDKLAGIAFEKKASRERLLFLNSEFERGSLSSGKTGVISKSKIAPIAMKGSMGMNHGIMDFDSLSTFENFAQRVSNLVLANYFLEYGTEEGRTKLTFAETAYINNGNAPTAYRPGSEITKYFLKQGVNECYSAALINSIIYSGVEIPKDSNLVSNLHAKIAKLTGSTDGRIDVLSLRDCVKTKMIPGIKEITIYDEDSSKIEEALKNKRLLMLEVPYFGEHVMAIIGYDNKKKSYITIDTVSGMAQNIDESEVIVIIETKLEDFKKLKKWASSD